jgi:hypothetical protein
MNTNSDEVNFFLINLEKDKFEQFFIKLLSSGVAIEMLDPQELGLKWQAVTFLNSDVDIEPNTENTLKLKQLEKAIEEYSPTFSFEEKYESGDVNQILENWQEKYIFDAVRRLNNNSIINKKFLQQKSILKKVKNKWYVTILKDLKALYTKYEIISKTPLIYKKFFKLEESSEVIFGCIAVLHKDAPITKQLLNEEQLDFEETSWSKKFGIAKNSKDAIYNLELSPSNPKWSTIVTFLYYTLCAFVVHDIFVGFVILIISLGAYRFELKNKSFFSQVWTGLGSIVFGVIGGSFAGNLLSVLSMSKYLVVKEIGNGLLGFLSLFQVIDWTNQNQNLLFNYNLSFQSWSPVGIFTILFILVSGLTIILGQLIKVKHEYKNNDIKNAIARAIFIVTIIGLIFAVSNLVPVWTAFFLLFFLFIYQPSLQISSKVKTFIVGDFGLFGFTKLLARSLWFAVVFGVLVLSTIIFNNMNFIIGDNVIILLIIDTIIAIILWQVVAFLVAKALQVNLVDELSQKHQNTQTRLFNPITKYKYWKF